MITFMESAEKLKESEKCLDSQLWHACAGSMVQIPLVNSKVFYFPQGHLEHTSGNIDLRNYLRLPSYVPCRVSAIKFMADPETDEVFAKIRLVPIIRNEGDLDDVGANKINGLDQNQEKQPISFAKTLTQSDANNGGGFSVPRYCAETIFPRLDYSADPPVQTILAKDVQGQVWKFRHIYRGTPRRHLLTTGWSSFVNQKKLVAGDSIVFLRAENGDLCVGIRRAKPDIGIGGVPHAPLAYSALSGEDESKNGNLNNNRSLISRGKVKAEAVIEAESLAANGQPFDVVYYPRAGTPEFFVKASLVKAAMQIHWCPGMRFKMAFETEDSSRISWFMGTVSLVQVADPIRWPDSPWRLLMVRWDEPDILQNVKRVSPWSVELVTNMSAIHLSRFSSPHKKPRLLPPFSYNHLLGCLPDNGPAGMQGARHAQYSLSLPDLHLNKLHSGFLPLAFPKPGCNENNISCLLTMGRRSAQESKDADNGKQGAPFLLFGRPILTEKQMSLSCSSDTVSTVRTGNSSSDCDAEKVGNISDGFESELSLETGHCKVFMESEDVGRSLDLSLLSSYEELYEKLASMFRIEVSEIVNHVVYRDPTGTVKQIGEEPFSDFMKTARRMAVVADSSSDDNVGV